METIGQLLLLLQDLLLIRQSVSEGDVLESILVHFLVFEGLRLFPLVKGLLGDLLSCSREHCVLSHTSLELLELLLDLVALRLLLVELGLQLSSHLVVPVLGLLQVDPDLVDVSQGVQVLVLVHLDIRLLVVRLEVRVHCDNLLLEVLVLSS